MPVSQSSRYYGLPVYTAADSKGRLHATIAMRLEPLVPTPATVYQHVLVGLETVEVTAAGYYHTSDAWWRIADANAPIFPLDWRPGMSLNLPGTASSGLVVRTRRF